MASHPYTLSLSSQPVLCHIEDVQALRVDLTAVSVTIDMAKPAAGHTKTVETLVSSIYTLTTCTYLRVYVYIHVWAVVMS